MNSADANVYSKILGVPKKPTSDNRLARDIQRSPTQVTAIITESVKL